MKTADKAAVVRVGLAYRDGLLSLEHAVRGAAPTCEDNADAYELARCLLRALSTGVLIYTLNQGGWTGPWVRTNREQIWGVFGAVVNWGYESPISKALQRLYGLDMQVLPNNNHRLPAVTAESETENGGR